MSRFKSATSKRALVSCLKQTNRSERWISGWDRKVLFVFALLLIISTKVWGQKYGINGFQSVSANQTVCTNNLSQLTDITASFVVIPCGGGTASPSTVNVDWYSNTSASSTPLTVGGVLVWPGTKIHSQTLVSVGTSSTITFILPSSKIQTSLCPGTTCSNNTIYIYCVISNQTSNCGLTNTCTNCPAGSNLKSTLVTVRSSDKPVLGNPAFTGFPSTDGICPGATYPFTLNISLANNYTWSVSNPSAITLSSSSTTTNSNTATFASGISNVDIYTISVTATGCGGSISTQKDLGVDQPLFSSHPASNLRTACPSTVSAFPQLSVSSTVTNPKYQWYRTSSQSTANGEIIVGQTNSTYTPPSNTPSTYYYYAVLTSTCSTTSTLSGLHTVKPIPTISTIAQDSLVSAGPVKINLAGLVPNKSHTISYAISGTTAGPPVANVNSDGNGKASFNANSTTGLTTANHGALLSITGLTITDNSPNCSTTGLSTQLKLTISNTTRSYRSRPWSRTDPVTSTTTATWTNSVPDINAGACDTGANAAAGTCFGPPVFIGHNLIIDQNISVDNGVVYFGARGISQPSGNLITDQPGDAAYSITIARSAGFQTNSCIVDIQSGTTTFEGALTINNGSLYIRNGATLIVGSCIDPKISVCNAMTIGNNSSVLIEQGGKLIVKGDVLNNNNGTGEVTILGFMGISGDYFAPNGNVNIIGSGEFVSDGSMTTQGNSTIFGSQNDCTVGPCSGTALACGGGTSYSFSLTANGQPTVTTPVSVCSGSLLNLSFTTTAPTPTLQWQISTIGPSTGFTNLGAPVASNQTTYAVQTSISGTAYYRMMYTPQGCGALYSNPATINISDPPLIATQPVSPGAVCLNAASPDLTVAVSISTGSIQSYRWYANGTLIIDRPSSALSDTYSVPTSVPSSASYYAQVVAVGGCFATTQAVTVNVGNQTIWQGPTGQKWAGSSAYWTCGFPDRTIDAVIPASMVVHLDNAAEVRTLTVDGSLLFNSGGSLSLYGNLVSQGASYQPSGLAYPGCIAFDAGATPVVTFAGTGPQSISGPSLINFHDMTITNTGGVVSNDAANLHVYGNITIGAGSLDADGVSNSGLLKLRSTSATQAASIGEIANASQFTGLVTIERDMGQVIPNKHRYVATPVTGFSLETELWEWVQRFGAFNYIESNPGNLNTGWTAMPSTYYFTAADAGVGFQAYEVPKRWDVRGTLTTGTVTFQLTRTATGSAADGWNVVGNPYPSSILWNSPAWSLTNVGATAYIPDHSLKPPVWRTYNANVNDPTAMQVIPMGQSFWVYAETNAPTLSVTEAAKVSGTSGIFYRKDAPRYPVFNISLRHNGVKDDAYIGIHPQGTSAYDSKLDGYKLEGLEDVTFSVATYSSKQEKMVYDFVQDLNRDIPIEIQGAPGTYELSFSTLNASNEFETLYLIDQFLGTSQPVITGKVYSFEVTSNPASRSRRFVLSASKVMNPEAEELDAYPNPARDAVQVRFHSDTPAAVTMVSTEGTVVRETMLDTVDGLISGTIDIASLPVGVYILQAKVQGRKVSRKVVKN